MQGRVKSIDLQKISLKPHTNKTVTSYRRRLLKSIDLQHEACSRVVIFY